MHRAHQVVVVGDRMQLPPTRFFTARAGRSRTTTDDERRGRRRARRRQLPRAVRGPAAVDDADLALPQPLRVADRVQQRRVLRRAAWPRSRIARPGARGVAADHASTPATARDRGRGGRAGRRCPALPSDQRPPPPRVAVRATARTRRGRVHRPARPRAAPPRDRPDDRHRRVLGGAADRDRAGAGGARPRRPRVRDPLRGGARSRGRRPGRRACS